MAEESTAVLLTTCDLLDSYFPCSAVQRVIEKERERERERELQ